MTKDPQKNSNQEIPKAVKTTREQHLELKKFWDGMIAQRRPYLDDKTGTFCEKYIEDTGNVQLAMRKIIGTCFGKTVVVMLHATNA